MTEFKGTKGQWFYDHDQESILSENGYIIADIFPVGQEANALLISKAPEMLEVLKSVKDLLEAYPSEAEIHLKAVEIRDLIKEATEL